VISNDYNGATTTGTQTLYVPNHPVPFGTVFGCKALATSEIDLRINEFIIDPTLTWTAVRAIVMSIIIPPFITVTHSYILRIVYGHSWFCDPLW
jgi:hypothetical protein